MTGTFNAAENTWTPHEGGWRYSSVHPENDSCRKDGCMVHNPDADWIGNIENWPYCPRADGRMERTCLHGVGHPDPNAARYLEKVAPNLAPWVHGCDGCCA